MAAQRRKQREQGAEGLHFPPALFLGITGGILVIVVIWLLLATSRTSPSPPRLSPAPNLLLRAEVNLPYAWRPLLVSRAVVARSDNPSSVVLWREGEWKQVPLPPKLVREMGWVSDGQFIYGYRELEEGEGRALVRWDAWTGEQKVIATSAPLVIPRGVYLSSRGRFVLFYLDNRTSTMTEIWVYDCEQDVARVVVENLNRKLLLTKPQWLAGREDEFLVMSRRSDGAEALLASALQTGAESFLMPLTLAPRGEITFRGAWRDGESLFAAWTEEGKKEIRLISWQRRGAVPRAAEKIAEGQVAEVWGDGGERLYLWLRQDNLSRVEVWKGEKSVYRRWLPAWGGEGIWVAEHTALLTTVRRKGRWYLGAVNLMGEHCPHLLSLPPSIAAEKLELLWAAGERAEVKDKKSARRIRERTLIIYLQQVLPRLVGKANVPPRGQAVWFDARNPGMVLVEFTVPQQALRALVELIFERNGLPRTHILHALWERGAGEWILKWGAAEQLDSFQAVRKYQYDPLFGEWMLTSSRADSLSW